MHSVCHECSDRTPFAGRIFVCATDSYEIKSWKAEMKHVAGRIRWIQQVVREGSVQLVQVSTAWNLSDIGTKPLGGNPLRLLLHEINMASHAGTVIYSWR
jgi:hypothetical protein